MYHEGNRAADALANIGIRLQLGTHVFGVAPREILDIVYEDVIGVSFDGLCN